ncbi:MAG: hypothetical protein IKE91_02385 [Clostridia bacterium]|nr:hypothetical protein [Clostridia bacterium]
MKMHYSISIIRQSMMALLCTLLVLLAVPAISAHAASAIDGSTTYDVNCDGVVDSCDVELIKDALLHCSPDYRVCDVVRAYRVSNADVDYSPSHVLTVASELNPSDENNMFFINTFLSDFKMVIHEDDAKIYFDLLEDNVIYFTTEWEKDYNVVYNLDIENDHIVQTEYDGLIYKVFIHGNKYKLDIVDPNYKKPIPVLTEYLVSDFTVEDSSDWFFINAFLSDFDKVVQEDLEAIYVELWEDGMTYFSIQFTKGVNIVFNEDLDYNYIVATEYKGDWYQVFVRDDKYMLNVVESTIGTAMAATMFSNDYPVGIEDVELVSDLFSYRYELESVSQKDNYVELSFIHCDGMAEYIIYVPCCEVADNSYYDEEGVDILGSVYYGEKKYVVFSEKIGDLYIVQVAVS